MDYGYLPLSRKMFDGYDPLWDADEPFDRRSAWVDLCQMAAYQSRRRVVGDTVVELEPGQLLASERFLAERWRWTRAKVRRFTDLMTKLGRIATEPAHQAAHVGSVITLCKYPTYNMSATEDRPTYRPSAQPGAAQERPKIEEGNKSISLTTEARDAAKTEMQADANAFYEALPPEKRVTFKADVRGIVSGDNAHSWRDGRTGLPVPWEERPARLRLAMDAYEKGAAESMHWALVFVHKQQDDPLELRSAEEIQASGKPRPGSEAAAVLGDRRRESPGAGRRQREVDGVPTQYVPSADETVSVEAERERMEAEKRAREAELVSAWEAENEITAHRIRAEVTEHVSKNPFAVPTVREGLIYVEYCKRVLAIMNDLAA